MSFCLLIDRSIALTSRFLGEVWGIEKGNFDESAAQNQPASTVAASALSSAISAQTTACGAVGSAEAGVTAAKQRLVADDTAVATAEQRKQVDQAAGQAAVANAQRLQASFLPSTFPCFPLLLHSNSFCPQGYFLAIFPFFLLFSLH